MANLLAGDIGGTKTRLQMETVDTVLQKTYPSAAYAGLHEIVQLFMREVGVTHVDAACFAIAGPTQGNTVKLTNLPWPRVDANSMAAQCHIDRILLINDFEAIGHGLLKMQADDMLCLQAGEIWPQGVRLLTGPGTGMGVAWMTTHADEYAVHASEGGHADFAPVNELQWALACYLRQLHGRATYEQIVSGPGLVNIFNFLRDTQRGKPSVQMREAMLNGDAAAAITHFALLEDEGIARDALAVFMQILGAYVGNLALTLLPRGGIFLAGGIAPQLVSVLRDGPFLQAYRQKGRFTEILESLPLYVVTHPHPGLLGAMSRLR